MAALDDATHLANSRSLNGAGRLYLYQAFEELGLRYVPTAANFILVDVGRDGEEVVRALAEKRVAVSSAARYGLRTSLRVTIGTLRENDRFITAPREVLTSA